MYMLTRLGKTFQEIYLYTAAIFYFFFIIGKSVHRKQDDNNASRYRECKRVMYGNSVILRYKNGRMKIEENFQQFPIRFLGSLSKETFIQAMIPRGFLWPSSYVFGWPFWWVSNKCFCSCLKTENFLQLFLCLFLPENENCHKKKKIIITGTLPMWRMYILMNGRKKTWGEDLPPSANIPMVKTSRNITFPNIIYTSFIEYHKSVITPPLM